MKQSKNSNRASPSALSHDGRVLYANFLMNRARYSDVIEEYRRSIKARAARI